MTVRVTIRTHAAAASVLIRTASEGEVGHNLSEETVEVGPRTSHDLHLSGKTTIEVTEHEAAVEEESHLPLDPTDVPGRAENDALLRSGEASADEARGTRPKLSKTEPRADDTL